MKPNAMAPFYDPEIMTPTQNQPSVASLTESLRGPKKEIFLKNMNDIIQIWENRRRYLTLFINNISVWWKGWKDNSEVFAVEKLLMIYWWRVISYFSGLAGKDEPMEILQIQVHCLTLKRRNELTLPGPTLGEEVCASVVNSAETCIPKHHPTHGGSSLACVLPALLSSWDTWKQEIRTRVLKQLLEHLIGFLQCITERTQAQSNFATGPEAG